MRSAAFHLLLAIAMAAAFPVSLSAYPSGLNLIPTADILEANNLRVAYESDGKGQPFGEQNLQYVYTEYGVGDRFEFGVDVYDITDTKEVYFNAKYLLRPESTHLPAIAAGLWSVSDVTHPAYYLTGYRSVDDLRVHVGVQYQSSASWLQFGVDYALTPNLTLLADYQTGTGRYHTIGLFYTPTSGIGISIYFARNNTPALRDTDYVGAYVEYTLSLE